MTSGECVYVCACAWRYGKGTRGICVIGKRTAGTRARTRTRTEQGRAAQHAHRPATRHCRHTPQTTHTHTHASTAGPDNRRLTDSPPDCTSPSNSAQTSSTHMAAPEPEHGWKFAQCFGDKGEADDVTEGELRTRFACFRESVLLRRHRCNRAQACVCISCLARDVHSHFSSLLAVCSQLFLLVCSSADFCPCSRHHLGCRV